MAERDGGHLPGERLRSRAESDIDDAVLAHPASDQLHIIERYSRPDFGHLKWEITIEDLIMYTRPWKVTEMTPLMTNSDLIEYVCTENERDSRHLDAIDAQKKAAAKSK